MNKCLTCQHLLQPKHGLWCSIEHKKDFYKKYYGGSNLAKLCEKELDDEKEKIKNSPEYKAFMKNVSKVGLIEALRTSNAASARGKSRAA